jgi:ferredoxin
MVPLTTVRGRGMVPPVSFRITDECINCGLCEDVCPMAAIREEGASGKRVVDRERCTECVGLYGRVMCQVECPVEACVPDAEHAETEAELLAKARHLMPEHVFQSPAPSHFR